MRQDRPAEGEPESGLDALFGPEDPAEDPAGDPAGHSAGNTAGSTGGDHTEDPREETAPLPAHRSMSGRAKAVLLAGVTASVAAVGIAGYTMAKPYLMPDDFEGKGSGSVTVRIAPGSSAGEVGSALADAGVVASARSFIMATEQKAVSDQLRPGHYRLRKGMAAGAAVDMLLAPDSRVVRKVSLPEGMRAEEALRRIATQSGLPLNDLQGVDAKLLGLPDYARGLEGFLYPATYEVEPGDRPVDVLSAMVRRFGAAAEHLDLAARARQVHLTPLEAVIVASIVQAEGGRDADYPKIARVIYNRLRGGTPLQLDTTVLYAQSRRTLKVSEKDTRVRSPYNTYLRKGLPPGPIANPGEKALMAALHPAKGDWYWFVTTDPAHRITKFTDKESEFVRYREELNENLGTG
ncbi:endolytic transglycosylase MltG [Nonomuraea sp. NBC_01738]|uniref:endolytic transglycosylase MltG n=1 Tax=Nonomuraea sp. NBC_01738 TaxID=2976003 RepID=UPI002E1609BE|nr:endolytic transglycosylase MltG [Nonomuraea sp. NBC_01738]